MTDKRIRKIVIVGGGTAGWMTASAISHVFRDRSVAIELIESDSIATVGVGEATIPTIRYFNNEIGVDEAEFFRATQATYKLGIEFKDWRRKGETFFHGFGDFGLNIAGISPLQYWLKLRDQGEAFDYETLCLPTVLARGRRYAPPHPDSRSPLAHFSYAYQFDAALYAKFLHAIATRNGVVRTEGRIVDVALRGEDGFIDAIVLQSGQRVEGDVFLDCSGFASLLAGGVMKVEYEDFSRNLPVNRAWAASSESFGELVPFTRSTALEAGWQWRIPLQHRTGHGYVFCNDFISEDEALARFKQVVDGKLISEPKLIKFKTGRRRNFWTKNCVALGLASGFLEPLESTSISLIQNGVAHFLNHFPDQSFDPRIIAEYNRVQNNEFDRIRDFIIMHYYLSQRDDTPFWQACKHLDLPETLKRKLEVYKACGKIVLDDEESFLSPSWQSLYFGLEYFPDRYDPLVDAQDVQAVKRHMLERRDAMAAAVKTLPSHAEFVSRYHHIDLSPARAKGPLAQYLS